LQSRLLAETCSNLGDHLSVDLLASAAAAATAEPAVAKRHDKRGKKRHEGNSKFRVLNGCEIRSRLLYRASGRRKYVVGVRSDQSDRAYDRNQNHCEHDRIFCNVLTCIFQPKLIYDFRHLSLQIQQMFPIGRKDRINETSCRSLQALVK
jgi:hypothetical protein